MNYVKTFAPEDVTKKAISFIEKEMAKGDRLEGFSPVRWEDGTQGFEFFVLDALKNIRVITITEDQLS